MIDCHFVLRLYRVNHSKGLECTIEIVLYSGRLPTDVTAAIDGPRLVRPEEFREAMTLAERCFGFESGGLKRRMPHCFDESKPERHAIVKRDGAVVSHVACVPAELRAGSARIECGGVAGVATDPDHRGEGYMTRLIEFWLERLDERTVPLAELEGDRVGYGRFGWENAGRERRYLITERSFGREPGGTDRVRQYRGPEDLDAIEPIHERERYRVSRDRRRYERLFDQRDLETLVFEGDRPAYLAHRGSDPTAILEFGGSREGLVALLATVLESADSGELALFTHPHHPLTALFREVAADWRTQPHRKLNVLDLTGTLEAYEPLLADRWRSMAQALGGDRSDSVTLALDGTEAGESVEASREAVAIRTTGDVLAVERTSRSPDVVLDRRTMTRLLFGSSDACWSIKRSRPILRSVLPLEYYFWQTETI